MMAYKEYLAKVEFDDDADLFHGEVVNTRDVITFQGRTVDDLHRAFEGSVEDYLAWCADRGKEPEKPYSGRFIVRVAPDVHRDITYAARKDGKSLNAWIAERLARAAQGRSEP